MERMYPAVNTAINAILPRVNSDDVGTNMAKDKNRSKENIPDQKATL